ncbi:putative serine/threonine-protein kinase [Cotonvirus japonicus]|uniref:non-specific serine/threonine protein kinase n=1 Tax=Cotonvirus japonicus TaxID=2811091 RepID=A0ABM7NS13_9VIRU|nr:putative serine/threonine-protein kinase [Cotonvirus japonicus]BCS82950.1 putative serine/threonine-protein kinase [Cotonvirus japonicus]
MSRILKDKYVTNPEDEIEDTLPLSEDEDTESESSDIINEEIFFSGLVMKENYILLKKIGSGNNAGVWMIYDIVKQNFYAMKIQDHECFNDGCREVCIVKKIGEYYVTNPNIYCVHMLDYFVYEISNNTKYVCSLYELYAGSIYNIIGDGKHKYGLPLDIVKNIVKQLLLAVNILHSELNIIHTDIKPENILFKGNPAYQKNIIKLFNRSGFQKKYDDLCRQYPDKSSDEKYAEFTDHLDAISIESIREIAILDTCLNGNEELIPDDLNEEVYFDSDSDNEYEFNSDNSGEEEDEDETTDKKYNDRLQSINDTQESLDYQELHNLDECYNFNIILNNKPNTTDNREIVDDKYVENCQIAVTDFGNSYFFNKRTRNEIQDRRYRAPEIILDLNYSYACDIWSVVCVAFELATGFALFEPEFEPINRDIQHLFMIEKLIDKFPLEMKKKSKRIRFLFDKKRNYHIKNVEEFNNFPMKERLVKQFLFNEKDAEEFSDFLSGGFVIDPIKRATASELLQHQWLN